MSEENTDIEKDVENQNGTPDDNGAGGDNPEDKAPTKEEFQSALVQKKKYREEAEQAKKEAEEVKAKLAKFEDVLKTETKVENKQNEVQPTDEEWKNKIEFITSHRELTKEEVDVVSAFSKGNNISLDDAYANEDVKLLLKAKREKVEQEKKTLAPNNGGGGKDTSFDVNKASKDEFLAKQAEIIAKNKK
jgi:uncharacterized protein (DUF3084 family)